MFSLNVSPEISIAARLQTGKEEKKRFDSRRMERYHLAKDIHSCFINYKHNTRGLRCSENILTVTDVSGPEVRKVLGLLDPSR